MKVRWEVVGPGIQDLAGERVIEIDDYDLEGLDASKRRTVIEQTVAAAFYKFGVIGFRWVELTATNEGEVSDAST